MARSLILLLLGATVVSAIIIGGGGGGRGFGGRSSSSSWSSEEAGRGRGHGHGHGHGGGRPPRPRPPRPPPRKCENGWMTFERQQGTWCVKVFYGQVLQNVAENMCQGQGATLTGVQTASERMQIANAGRLLSNAHGGGLAEIWIGASRKAGCNRRPDCLPNYTFQWTDGHTTGTAGFYFPGPEPNAVWKPQWGNQNCLYMHLSVNDGARARFGYSHGDLDDQHCQFPRTRLYACGKVPK